MAAQSTVKMTLTGFMGKSTTQDFQIVKPVIKTGNQRKRITAVVVDELPKATVTARLTDVIKQLTSRGLNLVDLIMNNDRVGPIDVLIGSDHHYDFILPHSITEDGVHLLKSLIVTTVLH
ncbi:hypothetical protein Hamer_G027372 [Homarus americanus]|uniref:Uncharacterized protein n=1 Tax=Homarus americanus TaxID=6706 RepID=A0A8J5JTC1_HOMAM|nr:hypothetical protein Hamer_G027372 [Homarus americanus]